MVAAEAVANAPPGTSTSPRCVPPQDGAASPQRVVKGLLVALRTLVMAHLGVASWLPVATCGATAFLGASGSTVARWAMWLESPSVDRGTGCPRDGGVGVHASWSLPVGEFGGAISSIAAWWRVAMERPGQPCRAWSRNRLVRPGRRSLCWDLGNVSISFSQHLAFLSLAVFSRQSFSGPLSRILNRASRWPNAEVALQWECLVRE